MSIQPLLHAVTPRFSDDIRADADQFVNEARELVTRARALVETDQISVSEIISIDRGRVFELLGRYQRFKHGAIFDPVIQAAQKQRSATARLLKCECILMGEAFSTYFTRWQHVNVADDWQAYRREMLAMSEQLLRHLQVEHAAIVSLINDTEAPEHDHIA
ncbi:hypothetical protein [Sphingomonas sp. XXL09]|uniref:hypothetical protein n=1 Tax=Sphingomonas sp. XXL09 TaxID=3457787 RepID=UPI00406BD794